MIFINISSATKYICIENNCIYVPVAIVVKNSMLLNVIDIEPYVLYISSKNIITIEDETMSAKVHNQHCTLRHIEEINAKCLPS